MNIEGIKSGVVAIALIAVFSITSASLYLQLKAFQPTKCSLHDLFPPGNPKFEYRYSGPLVSGGNVEGGEYSMIIDGTSEKGVLLKYLVESLTVKQPAITEYGVSQSFFRMESKRSKTTSFGTSVLTISPEDDSRSLTLVVCRSYVVVYVDGEEVTRGTVGVDLFGILALMRTYDREDLISPEDSQKSSDSALP